jgi:hypothetical protein
MDLHHYDGGASIAPGAYQDWRFVPFVLGEELSFTRWIRSWLCTCWTPTQ